MGLTAPGCSILKWKLTLTALFKHTKAVEEYAKAYIARINKDFQRRVRRNGATLSVRSDGNNQIIRGPRIVRAPFNSGNPETSGEERKMPESRIRAWHIFNK